ncbi:MAG TPA: hypothetical protein VFR97_11345 [Capillimicrobium sp.]|nr:hypothetical protein [Capillimicrobium sp.]
MNPLRIATLLAVAAACLAVAAPAGADSIAYIKGGDVWLASPDGKRKVRVTRTGDLSYVSQADNGTMIALAPNERLRKLSRTGKVLAEFPTYVTDGAPKSGATDEFHGPFGPEISPNGKLVAFEWYNETYSDSNTPTCNSQAVDPCYELTSRQGVGITRSDRFTPYEEYGLLTGWIYPQWLTNDMLVRSDAGAILNEDVVFNRVAPGLGDDELDRWFWDEWQGLGLIDAELTHDHRAAAAIAGASDEKLRVYRPLVEPFGAPDPNLAPFAKNEPIVEPCFELGDPVGGKFESLSFSPDGKRLAYGVGDGIWVVSIPDFSGGCVAPDASTNVKVIPGGRFPHWGPADLPKPKKRGKHRPRG